MIRYQTLVIAHDGLKVHPQKVIIEGQEFKVVTSADGHIPAQCDVLHEMVNVVAAGTVDAEELQNQAILAIHAARDAKVGGYDV